jgi:hypothetical protein
VGIKVIVLYVDKYIPMYERLDIKDAIYNEEIPLIDIRRMKYSTIDIVTCVMKLILNLG